MLFTLGTTGLNQHAAPVSLDRLVKVSVLEKEQPALFHQVQSRGKSSDPSSKCQWENLSAQDHGDLWDMELLYASQYFN